eukprot:1164854-Prymnesium_polylepis.2
MPQPCALCRQHVLRRPPRGDGRDEVRALSIRDGAHAAQHRRSRHVRRASRDESDLPPHARGVVSRGGSRSILSRRHRQAGACEAVGHALRVGCGDADASGVPW